jgi:hypothetical protein
MTSHHSRTRAARSAAAAAGVLLAASLAGCDSDRLLDVTDPGIVQPGQLNSVAALPAVFAAAVGDFTIGYSGNDAFEGAILFGGLLTDEAGSSDTFPTRNEVDQRTVQLDNANNADLFRTLQRGRASSERAADAFGRLAADDTRRSEALSLAGFSYVLLGETFCSGIPISRQAADEDRPTFGTPLTTRQIFEVAVTKFDTAIATSGTDAARRNLARVGRGRALLNLGRYADAAAAVAGVPADFEYRVFASQNTDRQNNGVFQFNNLQQRFTFIDREGRNGLPYVSANDPRVPIEDSGDVGFDGETEWLLQQKYGSRTASVPLAQGIEALLIRAEAALQAGNAASFVSLLNEARAAQGVTTVVTDPGAGNGGADRVNLLFRERAFALFLTAHRLGDLRRLSRPVAGSTVQPPGYGRNPESVFPSGEYFKGGSYGNFVNLPIPVQEQNNPNYTGSCNTAAP